MKFMTVAEAAKKWNLTPRSVQIHPFQDGNGIFKWVHTKHLYRDWSSIKACLIAFSIAPAIMFVFFTVVIGFMEGFSLKMLSMMGMICGGLLLGFWALTLPAYYLFAWAQGGVDEWEYEMDSRDIKGRKIAHSQGRLKVLRSIAWIMALFPMKPGQRLALNNFLYDRGKKDMHVDLVMLRGVEGDAKKGKIAIDTFYGSTDIYASGEDYAEVLAFIEQRLPKKGAKRKRTDGKKRVSATDTKTKEVTE